MKISDDTLKCAGLLLVGGIISFFSARLLYCAIESKGWPTTVGIVIGTEVTDGELVSDDNVISIHVPHVWYQYQVDGKTYKSDRLSYYDTYRVSKAKAQTITTRYRVGRSVRVYYSPADPSVSVLRSGISASGNLEPAALVIAFAFGTLCVMVVLYDWLRQWLANNESTAEQHASNKPIEPTC